MTITLTPKARETVQRFQSLLDTCHAHGTTLTHCRCDEFQAQGHCSHVAVLTRYQGLYRTTTVDVGYRPIGYKSAAHSTKATRYLADAQAIAARMQAVKAAKQAQKVGGFNIWLNAETFSTGKTKGVRLVINGQTVIDINPVHDGVEFVEMGHDLQPVRKLEAEDVVRIIQSKEQETEKPAPAKNPGYRMTMRDAELSYAEWDAKYTPVKQPPAGLDLAQKAIEATRQARARGLQEQFIQNAAYWIYSDLDNADALAQKDKPFIEGYLFTLSCHVQREERMGRIKEAIA